MPIARRGPAVGFALFVFQRQHFLLEVHHFVVAESIERTEEALRIELFDLLLAAAETAGATWAFGLNDVGILK